MSGEYQGYVFKIDFEPKQDFLEPRAYAHVFLRNGKPPFDEDVDVYTDNPRFEAAFLAALTSSDQSVEVNYDEVGNIKKVNRVVLDRSESEGS